MAEYIEREELMKFPIRRNHYDKEHGNEHFIYGIETVLEYAENIPAADVAPVVHAEWLEAPFESIWPGDFDADGNFVVHTYMAWKCSRCGRRISEKQHPNKEPYCHCGAKMDGGEE